MKDIPVLIIGFNRPQLMESLLENLKKNGVKNLYVSLDGPRNELDIADCRKTYEAVRSQQKYFELSLVSRKYNLGCCLGVISAVDWFFSFNDVGIIIEDDCLLDSEFFKIISTNIEESVDAYSKNLKILSAHNPFEFDFDDRVTKSALIHGWATNSLAWERIRKDFFKLTLPCWKNTVNKKRSISAAFYWWANSTRAKLGIVDTWDGIFAENAWRQGINTVIPHRNLVNNLGFGPSATHTKNVADSNLVKLPLHVLQNNTLDYLLDRYYFKIKSTHIVKALVRVVLDLLKIPALPKFEKRLIQDTSDRFIELP